MDKQNKKAAAPALQRGIEIIRLLADQIPRTLEELNRQTGIPKSSLLRFLETLELLNIVERDPVTRAYRALAMLLPIPPGIPSQDLIQ
ncbi:MAG: hypothetical protein D6820_15355, partial [Lentisphaerae bacterium]